MPDAYEALVDILDAIANERRVEFEEHARWSDLVDYLDRLAGQKEEAGRASIQAEKHLHAVSVPSRALRRCRHIADHTVEGDC